VSEEEKTFCDDAHGEIRKETTHQPIRLGCAYVKHTSGSVYMLKSNII
jgi:hypothetical protein